jgi:hypothetical protein
LKFRENFTIDPKVHGGKEQFTFLFSIMTWYVHLKIFVDNTKEKGIKEILVRGQTYIDAFNAMH